MPMQVIFPVDLKLKTNDQINVITPMKILNGLILATTRSKDYYRNTNEFPRFIIRTPKSSFYVLDVENKLIRPRSILAETETNKGYHYLLPYETKQSYHITKLQDTKYEAICTEYWDEFTHDKSTRTLRNMICYSWLCKEHVDSWNELAGYADSFKSIDQILRGGSCPCS